MDSLLFNRKNGNYLPAVLTDVNGVSFRLEVRTRGKFRRRKCEIPPVKLKFLKEDLLAHQLDTLNEIKLVLPCSKAEGNNDLIVREYIAYRMFESLTPYHTRARLVQLSLKHTKQRRAQKMFALLVEHEEQVVSRLNGTPVVEWGIPFDQLDMDQVALMTLFQFMIGNTDWDILACRNILLLKPASEEKLRAIPFDFDFSGLVNAPYAVPTTESNLRNVQDRFLMANGIDPSALQHARQYMLDHQQMLYQWLENDYVSNPSSREMRKYLDSFFEILAQGTEIPITLEFTAK